jgi:uncharacterized membrane protein YfcA
VAVGLVAVACTVGAFLLSYPILRVARDITSGNRVADAALGVLVFWVPLALTCVIGARNERRRGLRARDWFLLLLFVPLFDLNPFSRFGTNRALDHRVNTMLPGFLAGLAAGVAVLVVPVLLLGMRLKLRQRSAKG